MQLDKLTIKAQEALRDAQQLATDRGHPEIDTEHLVHALVRQEEGVVRPLLERVGVSADAVERAIDQALSQKPAVQGASAQRGISRALQQVLDASFELAREMQDDYVSTEHLFLAAVQQENGAFAQIAQRIGLAPDQVLQALQAVRGNQRVTDANPEDKYEALKKYGRDLTEEARRGKLDPVIGRDCEIRRVIQVLMMVATSLQRVCLESNRIQHHFHS